MEEKKKFPLIGLLTCVIILTLVLMAALPQLMNKTKEGKNLIFTIYSSRINCEPVYLYIYDDNTYEYFYQYKTDFEKKEIKTGAYTYDVNKIIENVDNYEPEERGPITIVDSNKKEYSLYDNNVELKEFLDEIDVDLDQCIGH